LLRLGPHGPRHHREHAGHTAADFLTLFIE
jgi:hypothetical protein